MDIPDLQILVFEVGPDCNLASEHKRCPAHLGVERYDGLDCSRPLDDHTIIETAAEFYRRGFNGLVAWHYYNEPLLYRERMAGLMARIRHTNPGARFLLWTNGTQIPSDPLALPQPGFDACMVTNYGGAHPPVNLNCARIACKRVSVRTAALDERRQPLLAEPPDGQPGCQRPYTEFVVDCFGNVHLCCIDWRGLASPGNILRDGLEHVIDRWRSIAGAVVSQPMAEHAPDACRRCPMRFSQRSNFT